MNDDLRWQAVERRDARADGTFVYAVRSTHIYCRPSCGSRRPNRERVTFYASPREAEAAGYRPCRRCQPDAQLEPAAALAQQACQFIEGYGDGIPTLAELGAHLHMSPFHVQRMFKRIMGISPRQYGAALRQRQFKAQIKSGAPVTEAIYAAGFRSSSRAYAPGEGQLGMTPTSYRRGGKDMQITYTLADSTLGRLLVAMTARGVCFVGLGDDDAKLVATLTAEYPAAEISAASGEMGEWVRAILAYIQGQQPRLDLPLDVQATAFQWSVWEALRAIPYGTTRSYSAIARELGHPAAARAVANACADNPVALAVPCHRVVREDGGLGGYRWGIDRKQHLLEMEHEHSTVPVT